MQQSAQKQNLRKTYCGAAVLFMLCFALLSMTRGNVYFMDEMDNFQLGLQMTKGGVLYDTLFSQHMPLMYYICAAMAKLGVHTVLEFRMAWYALLSLCYAVIYLRYSKIFGRVSMFLWPLFYIFSITTVFLCTSILAEQLQAIGMVMLALEFLHFYDTRKVSLSSAVCIAVAINISFLSAFVAAFGCAVIVLAFIAVEIAHCIRSKMRMRTAIAYLWEKYWQTICLTLAPMILLFAWLCISGTFGDFFYKAVTFNTEVYSRYQDGFGANPLAAITGCFAQYIAFAKQVFQTLFQGAKSVPLVLILLQIGQYAFLLYLCVKRKFVPAAVLWIFFILCGSRGFFNFHSLQIFALCALFTALLLGTAWRQKQKLKTATVNDKILASVLLPLGAIAFAATIFLSSGTYFVQRADRILPTAAEYNVTYEAHSNEALLQTLTEPGEYILENINDESLFLSCDVRTPSYNTAMSPWWWEGTHEKSMAEIIANPPRVAIFDENYATWGYAVKDFAPELTAFIKENYTQLYEDTPTFWVHRDYLSAAKAKLPQNDSSMVNCVKADTTHENLTQDVSAKQVFTATRDTVSTIAIQFGTHGRTYKGTVQIALVSLTDGETVKSWTISPKTLQDNAFYQVLQNGESVHLQKGQQYALEITATDASGGNNLTLWASENAASETDYAMHGDVPQTYNYRIKVR